MIEQANANAAWLTPRAMAHNLLRAAGALASDLHTQATTPTIRAHLIHVPARLARSARHLTLHLPRPWPWPWPWQNAWTQLFAATHAPPEAA